MINLFYPSSFLPHKNHYVLFSHKINNCLVELNIKLYLTIDSPSKLQLSNIVCLGRLSKAECTSHLLSSAGLFWISSTESFGLPLFEAAKLYKPIIALDKPYVKSLFEDSTYKICDLSDHEIINTLVDFAADHEASCLAIPSLKFSFNPPSNFLKEFHNALI